LRSGTKSSQDGKKVRAQCGAFGNLLTVKAENSPAIRFYQRERFVKVGRIPAGYLDQGREIDDVLMVCRLASNQEAAGAT